MTTQEITETRYHAAIVNLLNDGMPLEKIQAKLGNHRNDDLAAQTRLLKTMRAMWAENPQ